MTPSDLREIRRRLGETQAGFGRLLGGYSLRSVQAWEGGETDIPPAVARLVAVMGDERCPDWVKTPH